MSPLATRAWQVSGRVQGVFFRASTAEQAERLGLNGSAVNLADGDVYVEAAGSPEALDALAAWLQHGPANARVDQLREMPAPETVGEGFVVS